MALLQIQEPQKEIADKNQSQKVIIGIDLGTTNSLVGIIKNNEALLFADEFGNELHKSIVAFDVDGNVVSVGNQASAIQNSINISSIKRLMGKGLHEVIDKAKFQFDKGLDYVGLKIGQKKYSPEEISAEILKYLKQLAEKKLDTEIKEAVITVPAYFDEAAKNATKLAAKLAGLEVLRLVNEPTAAALAYGIDNKSEGIYCVYDLGGGTFDVSVLKIQQGVFKVLGVSGDNDLGGDDLDSLLAIKIQEKIKINFNEAKNFAKKIKEKLSYQNDVELDIASIEGNFKFSFSRTEFEILIAKKINKTILLTTKLINDLELNSLDIKGFIMVGGSSRIPLIHEKLGEIFGSQKILTNLDPDRVVAIGAAWQAFNLSGASHSLLLDVAPLSLGIEMMGGVVDKIILRNSTIPTIAKKEFTTYADNQTGMKLHIVQGEREFAKDCRSLAQFEIKNIPAMKAGMARIMVIFKVDADGLLTISAEEKITGQKQEIEVNPSFGISEEKIKNMLFDSMKNAALDMQNRLLAETVRDAKQSAKILQNDLQIYGELISQDEKNKILEKLALLEDLLENSQSRDLIALAEKELEKSAENLVLQKINNSLKTFVGKKA